MRSCRLGDIGFVRWQRLVWYISTRTQVPAHLLDLKQILSQSNIGFIEIRHPAIRKGKFHLNSRNIGWNPPAGYGNAV